MGPYMLQALCGLASELPLTIVGLVAIVVAYNRMDLYPGPSKLVIAAALLALGGELLLRGLFFAVSVFGLYWGTLSQGLQLLSSLLSFAAWMLLVAAIPLHRGASTPSNGEQAEATPTKGGGDLWT